MVQYIENQYLKVGVHLHGGSLASIYDKEKDEELLYQPKPDSWQGRDIAIFPFIARLKDKVYTHKGQQYSLRNHGLARYYDFANVSKDKNCLRLRFESDERTLAEYPFPFVFDVEYALEGKTLRIAYHVQNIGAETMPFGLGAHPAFQLDCDDNNGEWVLDGNQILFDRPLNLQQVMFEETGSFIVGERPYGVTDHVELSRALFRQYETVAFKAEEISHATLKRKKGRKIRFDFPNIQYFILWTFPKNGDFVAIEPWMSLPDFLDTPKEIMEKKTLIHLEPGRSYDFSYSLSI